MTMSEKMIDRLGARGLDIEILDRLGIDSVRRDGSEALIFPFKRRGQIVRRKYRWFDHPENRKWDADKGAQRILWNEDCLSDQDLADRPLIITEGELDAITAIQCGFLRTVSVPDGAPPPGQRSAEELDGSKKYSWVHEAKALLSRENVPEIILATDGDENGAALLQDLSVMLGRQRCKFITYPIARDPERRGRPRLKDLNEVLEDYGVKGVVETIGRAQWLKVNGIYTLSELPPLPTAPIYHIGFDAFGDNFKLRLGDFSVWTGTPNAGKSTLVQDIACRVAENYGLKTAWASFEQAPQTDHRRAFREWYATKREWQMSDREKDEADQWIEDHNVFIVPGEDDDVSLEWMLEKMATAIARHNVKLVVIDPWNEMDHQLEGRENETQYINRAIKTMKRFAKAYGIHLAIVAHPVKLEKQKDGKYPQPTLYDIHGGAVWYNKADLGVVISRDGEFDTLVKCAKSKHWDVIGRPGSVIMQYCADDRRFREIERVGVAPIPVHTPMEPKQRELTRLLDPDEPLHSDAALFE